MNIFEGYVGIRLWDGQLVDDVIFSLLLFLFIVFSFVFRTNFQLFVKMLKDAFLVKERQNLFDDVIGKSIFFFRNFMTFQVLFLSSIALIAVGRIYGFVNYAEWQAVLSAIGTVFCVLFLFYQFQSTYLYKVRLSSTNRIIRAITKEINTTFKPSNIICIAFSFITLFFYNLLKCIVYIYFIGLSKGNTALCIFNRCKCYTITVPISYINTGCTRFNFPTKLLCFLKAGKFQPFNDPLVHAFHAFNFFA